MGGLCHNLLAYGLFAEHEHHYLTTRYRKWCRQRGYNFIQSRAIEIHIEAQDLIAMLPKDTLTKVMTRQAINALNAISKSLEQLRLEIRTLATQLPEYPAVIAMARREVPLVPSLWQGYWRCDQVHVARRYYRLCGCCPCHWPD